MPPPDAEPIGLLLTRVAKAATRAFDDALAAAGGSRVMWLILLGLVRQHGGTQAGLAREVGVTGPTLSHHLAGMEAAGLVSRRRDPRNRRVQVVEITEAGWAMFAQLREAAAAHDRRLQDPFDAAELGQLRDMLLRLGDALGTDGGTR